MQLTREEQITVDSYNRHAKAWAAEHDSTDFWEAEFNIFREYVFSGTIIEIGCGGGRDASLLIPQYQYVGIDISEGLAKDCRRRHPDALVVTSNCYILPFRNLQFDGFWASAVLLHIPKSRIQLALLSLRLCLKNKAMGFISIKEGQGEMLVTEQLDSGAAFTRLFAYYDAEEFSTILLKTGYQIVRFQKRITGSTIWLEYFVSKG